MVNIKSLENKRIAKIESLDEKQVENYAEILIKELCELHDFNTVESAADGDDRLNKIADLYSKLNEIIDLTNGNFSNINNYIHSSVNQSLLSAKSVYEFNEVVRSAKLKNYLILNLVKSLMNDYVNLKFQLVLFYGMFKKLDYLNSFANPDDSDLANGIADIKNIWIAEFKKIIAKSVDNIAADIDDINAKFYSDSDIRDSISDLTLSVKNIKDSSDDFDVKLKEYGIVDAYNDLIDCYKFHLDLKEKYTSINGDIVALIESENVFYDDSVAAFDDVSGIDFEDFMNAEPKFNLKTMELT